MKEPTPPADQPAPAGAKTSWSCDDTATHMQAYAQDALDPDLSDQLVAHALRCPHCYATYWAPFAEHASRVDEAFLDELMGQGSEEGQSLASASTFDGAGLHPAPPLAPAAPETWSDAAVTGGQAHRFRLEPGAGVWLREVGTILPRVPKPRFIRAYWWYLGAGPPAPAARVGDLVRIRVEGNHEASAVWLEGLTKGAVLDGYLVSPGQRIALRRTHLLVCGTVRYLIEISKVEHTWKEVGLLRHAGPTRRLEDRSTFVGRERGRCAIPLRDQPGNANLEWHPGALDRVDPKERARLRRLTLDSVNVSRVHAELLKGKTTLQLRGHSRYPVYRIRASTVKGTREGHRPLSVLPGDLLRIGHQVFECRVV